MRSAAVPILGPMVGALLPGLALAGDVPVVRQHLDQAWVSDYQAPAATELQRVEALFGQLFRGQTVPQALAESLALRVREIALSGREYWVVDELPEWRQGRGYYLIAKAAGTPDLLSAPHDRNDFHTGDIALRVLQYGNFAGAAWNTTSRRSRDADAAEPSADFVHVENSYLHAFTRAWMSTHEDGKLVQLHGFSSRKHPGVGVDMIVSSGGKPAGPVPRIAGACAGETQWRTGVYGRDVFELGATTNTIGQMMDASGRDAFVHVEMNLDLRKRLLVDEGLVRALAGCLQ